LPTPEGPESTIGRRLEGECAFGKTGVSDVAKKVYAEALLGAIMYLLCDDATFGNFLLNGRLRADRKEIIEDSMGLSH
jgi:hypothetical protein